LPLLFSTTSSNQHPTLTHAPTDKSNSIYHSRLPQPTTTLDHQFSPRATLRSSAISNASVYSCQSHSLPVTNQHQNTFVDYYSRHHSQCLPQASLLAPVLLLPDLCHLSPNESLATQCTESRKHDRTTITASLTYSSNYDTASSLDTSTSARLFLALPKLRLLFLALISRLARLPRYRR
jgi:hypothetical protein